MPRCSRCIEKGTECRYDTEDLRRIANLRSINQKLEEQLLEHKDILNRLQEGPYDEAEELLQQLRASKDHTEGIRRTSSAAWNTSTSSSEKDATSPGGRPASPEFRGNTWHPALRIHISSGSTLQLNPRPRSISSSSLWRDPDNPSPSNLPSSHVELFGNFTSATGLATSGFSDTVQLQQSHRIPIHFVQSSVVVEDSPLSRVYTDYRDAARQLLAGGAPLSEVMGSSDFVNVELYFRGRQDDPFSANFWACEALKSFNEFDHVVKLGQIVLLTHLMRVCNCTLLHLLENTS